MSVPGGAVNINNITTRAGFNPGDASMRVGDIQFIAALPQLKPEQFKTTVVNACRSIHAKADKGILSQATALNTAIAAVIDLNFISTCARIDDDAAPDKIQ